MLYLKSKTTAALIPTININCLCSRIPTTPGKLPSATVTRLQTTDLKLNHCGTFFPTGLIRLAPNNHKQHNTRQLQACTIIPACLFNHLNNTLPRSIRSAPPCSKWFSWLLQSTISMPQDYAQCEPLPALIFWYQSSNLFSSIKIQLQQSNPPRTEGTTTEAGIAPYGGSNWPRCPLVTVSCEGLQWKQLQQRLLCWALPLPT